MTVDEALQLAIQKQNVGQLVEAEVIYRQVLAVQPNNSNALHLLGLTAAGMSRSDEALGLIMRAIDLCPAAEFFYNLGSIFFDRGKLDDAISALSQAVRLKADLPEAHYALGTAFQQKSIWDKSTEAFRTALQLRPNWAEAHCGLGVALLGGGNTEAAIASLESAILLNPGYAQAHSNLGNALQQAGRLHDAIDACERAIGFKPNWAEPRLNLGIALARSGHPSEAIFQYRRAIDLNPRYYKAYVNLSAALLDIGDAPEARLACEKAIELDFNAVEARFNLGNALAAEGRFEEAVEVLLRAVELDPSNAEVHSNLGNALREIGRADEAISSHRRAIELQPDYASAYSNLAMAMKDQGRLDDAVEQYRKAIAIQPSVSDAHNNLGIALQDKDLLDDAVSQYRRAVELNPRSAEAHNNLAILKLQGQIDEALQSLRRAVELNPAAAEIHSNLIFDIHSHPSYSPRQIFLEAIAWAINHAQRCGEERVHHSNNRSFERNLKIGYVSSDFSSHPVGRFMVPVVSNHNRKRFEVHGFSNVRRPDAMTSWFRQNMDHWHDIKGINDTDAANLIRSQGIDILIDLSLHTANNRLLIFARKPAPVQVTYLAYCSTSGMRAMDYLLCDPYLIPTDADLSNFVEQIIRLPRTYWCYRPPLDTGDVGPLPVEKAGFITFGSLNNFGKVTSGVLDTWCRIMKSTPNSKLILHAKEGSHRQRVYDKFFGEGIESARLEFVGSVPIADYFNFYHKIDIALDPFPFAGGTTTCDAVWMGVPVITLAGETAVSRGGLSILSNVGLRELVGWSMDEYVKLAGDLAADVSRLAYLRANLRPRMRASSLMDEPTFVLDLESAYRTMWRAWCGG